MALATHHVIKVSCGGYHTLALTAEQNLYAFGSCGVGECGTGDSTNCLKPRKIELPEINELPQVDVFTQIKEE
jgi:alpha-tubulin suppressor-like RCC1 family protein